MQSQIKYIKSIKINNLNTALVKCDSKGKAIGFEEYFEGGGGIETSLGGWFR